MLQPWDTPGEQAPLTPPPSVDPMPAQVGFIEADMGAIRDFHKAATNEAAGTGIPAGAAWRYEPGKFSRWLDMHRENTS